MAHTAPKPCRPLFALTPGLELVLASASPRRRQFLNEWGLPFRLLCPTGPEPRPEPGEDPAAYARRAATAKAHAVAGSLAHKAGQASAAGFAPAPGVILAADTVVAVDGDILGKPESPAHALHMLERLSGRGHEVVSAVCLLLPCATRRPGKGAQKTPGPAAPGADSASAGRQVVFSDVSRVFFYPWPRPLLQAYVNTGEPEDKAGAYAIQGQGAVLVERVEGSWSTVVGLPLTLLAQTLLDAEVMVPVDSP